MLSKKENTLLFQKVCRNHKSNLLRKTSENIAHNYQDGVHLYYIFYTKQEPKPPLFIKNIDL